MALEESFPAEVFEDSLPEAAPVLAAEPAPEMGLDSAPAPLTPADSEPMAPEAALEQDEPLANPEAEAVPEVVAENPAPAAFNEAEYLKTQFGEDAPETAAELKARIADFKANQITPAQRGQLALLDPANKEQFAKYAALAGRDYDAPTAREIMREHFALGKNGLSNAALDFRFDADFNGKYPTLAAALEDPGMYEANDPQLMLERELADYDSAAARADLKANQENTTQQFFADALSAQASTAPQASPEQIADATDVLRWSDETFRDGATLPIDLGNGQVVNMPIGDAKSFKEGFVDTDKLYRANVIGPDGKINRAMQAEIALFMSDPKGYRTYIANAVRGSAAPAISVAELTNSSARPAAVRPAGAAPATSSASNQPAYVSADDWQSSNA